MIASSRGVKVAAALLALGAHAGLVLALQALLRMGETTGEGQGPVPFIEASTRFEAMAGPPLQAVAPETLVSAAAAEPVALRASPAETVPPVMAAAAPAVLAEPVPSPAAVAAPQIRATERVSANMLRPAPRPQRVTEAHAQRAATRQAARPARQQTASRASTAQPRSDTTAQPTPRRSQAARAAAQAYPNQVYRCLARAGRVNARGRGTARVSFAISSNGRVGNVALARSSGNRAVDRAVLAHIRRAGPCPAPPRGAQRQFVIPVQVN